MASSKVGACQSTSTSPTGPNCPAPPPESFASKATPWQPVPEMPVTSSFGPPSVGWAGQAPMAQSQPIVLTDRLHCQVNVVGDQAS